MTRDYDVLSDQELFNKTKRIAEFVRNAKIKISFGRSQNWCKYNGQVDGKSNFSICLSSPIVPHIQKYTALLHELSHIIYQTPFNSIHKLVSRWDHKRVYFNVFNILEDARIESHLTKEYIAYQRRFWRTLLGLGRDMKLENINLESPIDTLLAIRFLRDDIAEKCEHYEEYKEALENVKYTDRFGGLRILLTIKHLIDDFVDKREKKPLKHTSIGSSKKIQEEIIEEQKDYENNLQSVPSITEIEEEYESQEEFEDIENTIENGSAMLNDEREEGISQILTEEEKSDLVETSKTKGEEEHDEVRSILLEGENDEPLLLERVKYIERVSDKPFKINYRLSKGLNRLFRNLKMAHKPFIDYEGVDVNVSEYIENFVKGVDLNKSMNNKKITNGVSIVVSIDASTSMKGLRIDSVRDLISTLYHSLKTIQNVEIKGNVWSSNYSGEIGITEINGINDVNKISVNSAYPFTPTHMALDYSNKMLKSMKGKKKLLLIITDGLPNYRNEGNKASVRNYRTVCRKALRRTLKITPNVVFVVIKEHNMRLMGFFFDNKRLVKAETVTTAMETVISNFRRVIMSVFV